MPWIFALDHTNYSRWLSVHIRDMMNSVDPDVLVEFKSMNVVHKTNKTFSAMLNVQCHEHNNVVVQGCDGAIALIGNPMALRRWMVAGP